MSKITLRLLTDAIRERAIQFIRNAPVGWIVTISEATRTLEQNSLLWPLLTEISRQAKWHNLKMDNDSWKAVFVTEIKARYNEETKLIPNYRGTGFIDVSGASSRVLPKRQFSDLIELIYSFGAENGVKFNE